MKKHILVTCFLTCFIITALWIKSAEIWSQPPVYKVYTHRTLYVDRRMDDQAFALVSYAAIRWSVATNHIVDFDVVRLPITDHKEIMTPGDIIVLLMPEDYPDVIVVDGTNEGTTLGYFRDSGYPLLIGIIGSRIDTPADFEAVILHELGHAVGLPHNEGEDGLMTLMYPSMSLAASWITKEDIVNFCHIYNCDPDKLQYEEEPLHF